ncbi:4-hydroxy-tetrahydrodipicolinate synthase [Ahniella affigens]|uniref:4-hydroxy-tetrahydrodipicolinate synthase n=1 Tax=Ahniella affigens TaxID=2021234 RepID=A0A2P1PYV2_9GAMM|nr:4-hydroxy-tetrahydrodipicolinate synthase [Ahniella affigens]AVQ00022.1 4-hydroxy-tetrahydrodipicolinate synthase [Ahniella affigens]
MRWSGSICALVTPFDASGALDVPALQNLLDWHQSAGTSGLVIAGSTGEAALLEDGEYEALLQQAAQHNAGRLPLIAGVGSPSTQKTIRAAAVAKQAGYQAVLAVTPYYVRPTQAGLKAHYVALADASALPVILYNVPGRTGSDLLPETVAELCTHDNIVGIKEARAEPDRMQALLALQADGFDVLSGDDGTGLRAMQAGARGIISVAANVVPEQFARMCRHALAQEFADAQAIDDQLRLLYDALGIESNPIPAKFLLAAAERCQNVLRLPLQGLAEPYRAAVLAAWVEAELA